MTDSLQAITRDRTCFTVSQQRRIRVETGRIKEPARLLAKAQHSKYAEVIKDPEDVFRVLTDVVGTRVTCNTVQDVLCMVEAIKQSKTLALPGHLPPEKCAEDYITNPRQSGYRAAHLLVSVDVPAGSDYSAVVCEIQVRTLLQHAWGELTHEDTFKPEVKVPGLVTTLSKRLATALAVLDEIAQDLRDELAKIEDEVAQPVEIHKPTPGTGARTNGKLLRAVFAEVMGRELAVANPELERARSLFGAAPLLNRDQVWAAISGTRDLSSSVFAKHPVLVPDSEFLFAAAAWPLGPNAVEGRLTDVATRLEARIDEMHEFEELYAAGHTHVGTVVRVKPRYSLVQLTSGDTATMSARHIEAGGTSYVNLEDYVSPGSTIRVEVVNADADRRRIEVRPADGLARLR
ncbi:hypothetical protein [Geodermatophilus sp. DSM 44513]|uniref:hypothetical protein n=1 Tax=Geodermatophilus sp. DSM 44513 TaxID=1528104 RepID=UPI001277E06E|nr:hypothetical protein [Geodermatophilus sp. DSM 44513]WNV76715.1 hypothetical protein RTG05_05425 [Geodermatophilus sp. DSM 44513]